MADRHHTRGSGQREYGRSDTIRRMTAVSAKSPIVHLVAVLFLIGGLVSIWITIGGGHAQTDEGFDSYFIEKTMRVDYFHSGGVGTENLDARRPQPRQVPV